MSSLGYAQRVVLHEQRHNMQIEVDLRRPVPIVYDRSERWKAHPPSKRKRMRSWRRAPDKEKLRYAPLRDLDYVPWWAAHPDRGRTLSIGTALVGQRIRVFAQHGADLDEALRELEREWISDVLRARVDLRRAAEGGAGMNGGQAELDRSPEMRYATN